MHRRHKLLDFVWHASWNELEEQYEWKNVMLSNYY
jgi:hypothetical protein